MERNKIMDDILPKKHKKEIITLCAEHYKLCHLPPIRITLPKIKVRAEIGWYGDESVDVDEVDCIEPEKLVLKSREIIKINKKIKKFCQETDAFGRKNFKNKNWIWEKILWDLDSNGSEKFNPKKYTWK
jgi:hypothetical protein